MTVRDSGSEVADRKALIGYTAAVDEFIVTFGDASEIEVFEPIDDLEVVFDATQAGRMLELSVRGARLGRAASWLEVVRTVCGPTLWAAYEELAGKHIDVDDDDDETTAKETIPGREWTDLRYRRWPALHLSLRGDGDGDDRDGPALFQGVPGVVDQNEPWVLAAPWPRGGEPTHLHLPPSLAALCGLDPVGYVQQTDEGLVLRFDLTAPGKTPPAALELELASPFSAAVGMPGGNPELGADEVELRFTPERTGRTAGMIVVVGRAVATASPKSRVKACEGVP